jgi:hypothetical protein
MWQFADLRYADHPIFAIYRFATPRKFPICGLNITNLRICDLRTGTPENFADLQLRNKPKKKFPYTYTNSGSAFVSTFRENL